jgi:hypothetical protein
MSEELISDENISKELLKEIFEGAYYDVSVDEKGDMTIKDSYSAFADVSKNRKLITFSAYFNRDLQAEPDDIKDYLHHVNYQLLAIRVSKLERSFFYEYTFNIQGGVTRKNIVYSFKTFMIALQAALSVEEFKGKVFGI